MLVHARHLVIVEARSPDAGIVQREPERPDEVQRRAGIRAKPDDVSGVGRDFGLEEDDVEHAPIIMSWIPIRRVRLPPSPSTSAA